MYTTLTSYNGWSKYSGQTFSAQTDDETEVLTGTIDDSGCDTLSIPLPDDYIGGVHWFVNGVKRKVSSFDYRLIPDNEGINSIPAAVWSHEVGTATEPAYEIGEAGRGAAMLQRAPYDVPVITIPDASDPRKVSLGFVGSEHGVNDEGAEVVVSYLTTLPVCVDGVFDTDRELKAKTDADGNATFEVYASSVLAEAGVAETRRSIRCQAAQLDIVAEIPDGGASVHELL